MLANQCHQSLLRRALPALGLGLALVIGGAQHAQAGDFYVSGGLALSGGFADGGGTFDFGTPVDIGGDSTDTSPVLAGAIGFEFPVHQILPRRYRSPRWMPDIDLEDWIIRIEHEAAGGRQYDLLFSASGTDSFRTKIDTVSTTINAWLGLPLGHAIGAIAGRSRTLEDLTFDIGVGIGYQRANIKAKNLVAGGKKKHDDFLWQVGADFGYPLSDSVVLSLGYRYIPVGKLSANLVDNPGTTDRGKLTANVDAHEFRTALRYRFYSVRFPRGLLDPDPTRDRYEP